MAKRFTSMLALIMIVGVTTVKAADTAAPESNEVHFAVSSQTLLAALTELKAKTGLEFSVSPDIENDVLTMELRDSNWQNLVHRLLSGYNYVGYSDAKTGKLQVLVSSRAKDRLATTAAVAVSD